MQSSSSPSGLSSAWQQFIANTSNLLFSSQRQQQRQQDFIDYHGNHNDEKGVNNPLKPGIDEGNNSGGGPMEQSENVTGDTLWRPIDTDVPEVVHGRKVQPKEYEKTMYKPGVAAPLKR